MDPNPLCMDLHPNLNASDPKIVLPTKKKVPLIKRLSYKKKTNKTEDRFLFVMGTLDTRISRFSLAILEWHVATWASEFNYFLAQTEALNHAVNNIEVCSTCSPLISVASFNIFMKH